MAKAVEQLTKESSHFRAYYKLPTAKPFAYVIATSMGLVLLAGVAAFLIYHYTSGNPAYPIYSALMTISAVAVGWWVVGRMTHRNTIRQNTNAMVFARFQHAVFNDAMNRFHVAFGYDPNEYVSRERVVQLRDPDKPEDFAAAGSVLYLLNYFEFIASGVISGDLDAAIIRDNLRGFVVYYYDKCEPYIRHQNKLNHRAFQNLIKLRTAYRET
jgi:Domain of unknown function (DUF4760)